LLGTELDRRPTIPEANTPTNNALLRTTEKTIAAKGGQEMGLDQKVVLPEGQSPSWPAARDLLAARGCMLQIRMIDGELAFPDEEPSDQWRELRVATQEGQPITVKRNSDEVQLVIWGNADQRLIQAWNALTWAFAETGQGMVHTEQGAASAIEYLKQADLPESVRAF
jgi:hypothetical protein